MRRLFKSSILLISFVLGLSPCSLAQQVTDQVSPEIGEHIQEHQPVAASEFIVAAAHPLATQAGFDILEKGGNAIDAMVAVQTTLGLVEPQSSGLGGGAFLVYYDAKSKQIRTFDGRETAPKLAPSDLFMKSDDNPMDFFEAVVGGRSVGTPGTPLLLWETHKELGALPWSTLLQPAIDLASRGFHVTPRLANAVKRDEKHLKQDKHAYNYFFPLGKPIESGQILKNPAYANTLTKLSLNGGNYFYRKEFAQFIVSKIKKAKNPGFLSLADFEAYRVIERKPQCVDYRGFEVCGMGPPSSGAISVGQTLGILENFDLKILGPDNPTSWHLIAEASRLAFSDRGAYLADPDFIDVPKELLDKEYLKSRAALISTNKAAKSVNPGLPKTPFLSAKSPEQASTTHFVIVDKQGNIVSMTSTIENGFGARLMVNGFLLNNELTDFSFSPTKDDLLVANRVEPGKRPRSSMAPTIVLKDNLPYLALGSPGGSRIIPYVTNSLISIIDWEMGIQEAFNAPHIVNRFGTMDLEQNTEITQWAKTHKALGHKISIRNLNSGLHGVRFTKEGMVGAADPRREGQVLGR